MIQNIIQKEFLTLENRLNILYIPKDKDHEFNTFVYNLFPLISLINFDDTFYGINNPHIIITMDMAEETLIKCVELCKYFHIPLLLIFDKADDYKTLDVDIHFQPSPIVSLSNTLNKILLKKYNAIMKFDTYNKKSIDQWRSYILELCSSPFIINDINNEYHNK